MTNSPFPRRAWAYDEPEPQEPTEQALSFTADLWPTSGPHVIIPPHDPDYVDYSDWSEKEENDYTNV